MTKLIAAFRNFANAAINLFSNVTQGRQECAWNYICVRSIECCGQVVSACVS